MWKHNSDQELVNLKLHGTHYVHLFWGVASLDPARCRLLIFLESPPANCFCLEEDIASDFQFVDISLSGLTDRDFERQSVGLTMEPEGFVGTDIWFLVEAQLLFLTEISSILATRACDRFAEEQSESEDEGLVVLSIS